jgi:myo-inositol-1(or 4)-monophosphatase
MKGWADPVTAADRAAEAHIRAEIAKAFPDDGIHGEEEGRSGSGSGRVWVVDPLDGTANFAGGMPIFAVCITLVVDEPVVNVTYDPIRDESFEVIKGGGARMNGATIRTAATEDLAGALIHIAFPRDRRLWEAANSLTRCITEVAPHARNIGSSALAQAWVACGRLHAHARVSAGEFDIVGGNLMIAEAGGIVSDLHGRPFEDPRGGLLTASPRMHRVLLDLDMGKCLDAALEE